MSEGLAIWQQPALMPVPAVFQPYSSREHPEEFCTLTEELIARQGYCLWQCHQLGGAVIAVVEKGSTCLLSYPVYSLHEIDLLWDCSPWLQAMVLEAKKLARAQVISVKRRKLAGAK